VNGEEVVVMVESCEYAHDVDLARAELARERAEQGLAALGGDADEKRIREYEAALDRARNRIAVAQKRQH
jgi:F0F1-type ATP synthase epsilon subunit